VFETLLVTTAPQKTVDLKELVAIVSAEATTQSCCCPPAPRRTPSIKDWERDLP